MSTPAQYLPSPTSSSPGTIPTDTESNQPQRDEQRNGAVIAETPPLIVPLTIWMPSQFLAWEEPLGSHFLLPKYLTREQITSIIGPPGVGKSRAILWLSICQITRRPWCGLETAGDPQKWLLLGDENSVGRMKHDLTLMLTVLSESERRILDELLRIQALITPEDGDLDLQDDVIAMRVIETLKLWSPGIVGFDPLASFYSGDLSKPGEMKFAVRLVQQTVNAGARGAATIISHHARPGRMNTIQAVGFDAGNFASGGKALLARSRCVINLAEADENGTGNIVVACAKANDCGKFDPRGVHLDPETMTYTVDPAFSVDSWKAAVEGKASSGSSLCTLLEIVRAVRDGHNTTRAIAEAMEAAYMTPKRTVERLLKKAIEGSYLTQMKRGEYTLGPKHNRLLPNEK